MNLLKTKSQNGENPYKYIDATQPEQTNGTLTKEMLNKHYDLYEKS